MFVKRVLLLLMFGFSVSVAALANIARGAQAKHDGHGQEGRRQLPLKIAKGDMSLGGRAAVNYFSSEANFYGGFYGQLEGNYAYFLIDSLALGVNLNASSTIDRRLAVAPTLTLGVSLEYIFNTSSIVYPYVGAGVGFAWKPLDPSSNYWMPVRPGVGVLVALSDAVALDLGVNTTITFALEGSALPLLDGTAGLVGVRAFF